MMMKIEEQKICFEVAVKFKNEVMKISKFINLSDKIGVLYMILQQIEPIYKDFLKLLRKI